jgi:hypothetical protein
MRRPLRILALSVALPVLLLSAPAGGAEIQSSNRIYLLSSDDDYLYWSVDRFDPELGVGSTTRTCGTNYLTPGNKPCLIGRNVTDQTHTHNLYFLPGSALDEKVTWSSDAPLQFHFDATVNTFGVPYSVQLVIQKTATLVVSEPATQTSSGVWEGKLTTGGPLNPNELTNFGVRVTTQSPVAVIDLKMGGRTYLELPQPVAAHSVPDMLREDDYAPQRSTYTSPSRSFEFNDANWEARTFTGDTSAPKTFDFTIGKKAESLLIWADLYESPFVQDVRRLRQPDLKKLQGIGMLLSRDGTVIEGTSSTGAGTAGQGTPSVTALDLPAGPLTLAVDPWQEGSDMNLPYTVHVLEIQGERTLRSMRWRFVQGPSSRSPAAATCPASTEGVPATSQVKSVALDLDWSTEAVGLPRWTFRFDMPYGGYPCSEAGTGDEMRLTIAPADRVWWVSATPSYGTQFVSVHDTTFEMTARFTYSPVAAAPIG